MSDCTDKTLGKLLYAYELGMLTEEEALEVEQHLYACEYCFHQAKESRDVTLLLRHSPRIQSQLTSDAAQHRTVRRSWMLLAAAAVIVLAFPVYRLIVDSTSPPVVQSLQLAPFRGSNSTVLDLDQGGIAEIQFVVEGASAADTHRVVIAERKGPAIYTNDALAGFNEFGQGTISLPVNSFKQGYYVLTVTSLRAKDTLTLAEYPFRVK